MLAAVRAGSMSNPAECTLVTQERLLSYITIDTNETIMAVPESIDADPDDLAHAVGFYALGEVNEGRAAEIAGVTRWQMRDILTAAGLELRLGPRSEEDLRQEVASALGRDSDDLVLEVDREPTKNDGE